MLLRRKPKPEALNILDFYKQTIPENEKHVKMCGNLTSKVVLVTGHPTEEELSSGIPFTTEGARIWLNFLEKTTKYTVDDMLVFSSSPYGKGPTVKSTQHTLEICQRLARNAPRVFLFCGAVEFGLTVNKFRKKASSGLYGAVMYLPQLIGSKVVVLPTPANLYTESQDWKEQRNAQYFQGQLLKVFNRLSKNLRNVAEIT